MKDKKVEQGQLSIEEMQCVEGGWKLFCHEDTAIAGTNCIKEESSGNLQCTQDYEVVRYVFGIPLKPKTINAACSYGKGSQQCKTCNMC